MKRSENSAKEEMRIRGEKTVLHLQKKIGLTLFRYTVGERRGAEKEQNGEVSYSYSIYVEYENEEKTTFAFVTDFSNRKARALSFCEQLARELVTPLSLPFIYEDSLTP